MLTLETQAVRRKSDALELESGRRSLTAQIERSGLRPVVVGADGRVYERDEWAESKTFWQMRQENVLVEDNQTEQFAQGDEALRSFLSRFAWAERARY
jgi:hypothetical protein